jgi:hypothetical protein
VPIMETPWRESRKVLLIIGIVVAAVGALALAMTLGYYTRGNPVDQCNPNQPWWNSPLLLIIPPVGLVSIVAGFVAPSLGRLRLVLLRALAVLAGGGLLIWSAWFLVKLSGIGAGCGFP